MDVEIYLDLKEVSAENRPLAFKKFQQWYREGSEVRHNKMSFGSLTTIEPDIRFLIDFGYADALVAIRNLHARVRNLGVKVFVHFIN